MAWVVYSQSNPPKIFEETRYMEDKVLKGLLKIDFSDEFSQFRVSRYIQNQKLKVVVVCNESDILQRIDLREVSSGACFASRFDPTIRLDENRWAVTLLSTKKGSFLGLSHTMIAYEGVEDGNRFLKGAHITRLEKLADKDDPLREHEALVEIRDYTFPLDGSFPENWVHSPTWERSKIYVENMIQAINKEKRVKFLPTGYAPQRFALARFSSWWYGGRLPEHHKDLVTNCRDWALGRLLSAGIRVTLPPDLTPHQVIDYLVSHPEAVTEFCPERTKPSVEKVEEILRAFVEEKKTQLEEKAARYEQEKAEIEKTIFTLNTLLISNYYSFINLPHHTVVAMLEEEKARLKEREYEREEEIAEIEKTFYQRLWPNEFSANV